MHPPCHGGHEFRLGTGIAMPWSYATLEWRGEELLQRLPRKLHCQRRRHFYYYMCHANFQNCRLARRHWHQKTVNTSRWYHLKLDRIVIDHESEVPTGAEHFTNLRCWNSNILDHQPINSILRQAAPLSASSSDIQAMLVPSPLGCAATVLEVCETSLNGVTMADDSILAACILPNAKTSLCSVIPLTEREPIAGLVHSILEIYIN